MKMMGQKMIIGDSDAAPRMRAHVDAYGCNLFFGESREIEDSLYGDLSLRSVRGIAIADAAPTYPIGEQGDAR
jgi:hypothetical protein